MADKGKATPEEEKNKAVVRQTPADDYFLKYYYDPYKIAKNCTRWGSCRWSSWRFLKDSRFSKVCPSSAYYLFDSYSLQGRLFLALALMEGRMKYEDSPELMDIIYKCNMCGGCDAMCKLWENEMEGLRVIEDLRAKLVADGQLMPAHMIAIDWLKKENNMMMQPKAERGKWAEGLKVKDLTEEKAEVCFHAGCLICYDEELWKVARGAISLLIDVGVDVGIMGGDETCCGGRVYEMGYRGEFAKYAENNIDAWNRAGVKTVITCCSDCYCAIKRRYPEIGSTFEVLHMVEFMDKIIKEGKLKLTKEVPMKVTYHDPCHLGRRTDVYVPGKPIEGVFEPPRDILRSIPGLELVEMERIREYAWCCGSGCRVREDYPDFNAWTAGERIEEAMSTGAEALVTACPWCERTLTDAVNSKGEPMQIYDLLELVRQAI
ncbi:(Fe-S)-binding protein [Chloroflexota bacterium]